VQQNEPESVPVEIQPAGSIDEEKRIDNQEVDTMVAKK